MTEERWEELGDLKSAGQTWDDLLGELVEERKKARLFRRMQEIEERDEWVSLDDLPPEDI